MFRPLAQAILGRSNVVADFILPFYTFSLISFDKLVACTWFSSGTNNVQASNRSAPVIKLSNERDV